MSRGEELLLQEPSDKLVYAAQGPFGAADDCVLAVAQTNSPRKFYATLQCGSSVWHEPLGTWSAHEFAAVRFVDVDGDEYVEAVVSTWWVSGRGPDGMIPFLTTSVLGWTGQELQHLREVEKRVERLQSLDAVSNTIDEVIGSHSRQ
jgi:hypothetical protein